LQLDFRMWIDEKLGSGYSAGNVYTSKGEVLMRVSRLGQFVWSACALAAAVGASAGDATPGENLIDLKLTLPKGDTYLRGASDPVADLAVQLTLTNKSEKEDLGKKTVTITEGAKLTSDEFASLKDMKPDEQAKFIAKKITTRDIELYPVNPKSFGYAYVEPQIGGVDTVEFIITKLPDAEAAPEAPKDAAAPAATPAPDAAAAPPPAPAPIARDHGPDFADPTQNVRSRYVAAGETTEPITLNVGKYYKITEPGMYSIKASIPSIGDSTTPDKVIYSNEEKFRVLPFKAVDQSIDFLRSDLADNERGYPRFDYMLYQTKAQADFDEVYALQRNTVRRIERWEWTRICTVKTGTTVQLAQLAPKKVALLAVQGSGEAGLYTLDFSAPGVKITSKSYPAKADGAPKLKVEGGNISVE
jgi:hypothetical protein